MSRRLRFLNPLTRDAAYNALLESNARLLHATVADILSARHVPGGPNENELLLELAHHCAAAGRLEQAHRHCAAALYAAVRAGAFERAARLEQQSGRLWEAARSADPGLPEISLTLLFGKAELRIARGDHCAARELLDILLVQARRRGDKEHICRALTSLAGLQQIHGELDAAESSIRSAEALAAMLGDPTLERFTASVMGSVLLRRGDPHAALDCMQRSLEIARQQGNISRTAAELSNLASVEASIGELAAAEQHYRESLELARWLGNTYLTGLAAGNLGDVLHEQGRSAAARTLLHEALGIAREIGHRLMQGYWLNALGYLELDNAAPGLAFGCFEEARELFSLLGDKVQLASVLCGMALALLARQPDSAALEQAGEFADQAQLLADEAGIDAASFTRRMLARASKQLAGLRQQ